MTTTYELYTNENGTPKLVEGKAPAIVDRVEALETSVEALETSVESLEGTLDSGVVTSVNGQTGDVTVDVGVTSVNGNTGDVTPEQTGCLPLSGGTMTGDLILSGAYRGLFHDNTDGVTIIGGGTGTSNGGSFYAIGETNSKRPGYFVATARTSDVNGAQLIGKPDGTLTWANSAVVTLAKPLVPNYGAGVSISSNYTAPSAGVVIVKSINGYSGYTTINVNGHEVAKYKATAQLDSSGTAWVNKGDKVTFENGGSSAEALFYPLKIGG